jgi:hypothetical protein
MNRTITVTGIEPAPLSIRHPLGINLDLTIRMTRQNGNPVDPTLAQFVLLPRSRGGFVPFDMDAIDVANGIAGVEVPGSALTDFAGYGLELYLRKEADDPANPPVPTWLAATGVLRTQGSAYQQSSLAETTLPTVVGPMGPKGDPGDPGGPPGQRGSLWFTGTGAPGVIDGVLPADMYLDEGNGDVYRYDGVTWVRGSF